MQIIASEEETEFLLEAFMFLVETDNILNWFA